MTVPYQTPLPHSLYVGLTCALILCIGLCSFAVCTRIYIKLRVARSFLSEDYCSVAGYLGFMAYLGVVIVIGKSNGLAYHKAFLSTIEELVYMPIIVLVKTSILLQYITIFVVHRRSLFHFGIHFLIWANVIFYIIIGFLYLFECTPRRKLWIPDAAGHCRYTLHGSIFSGCFNVVSDFLILILPLPVLLRLQMPSNKKYRLLFVFSFGLFGCIASVVRLVYSVQLPKKSEGRKYQLQIDREGLWASVEIAIGIMVGCMPHIHKALKEFSFKTPMLSRVKVLCRSRGQPSWRMLFSKSSTSEPSFSGSNASTCIAPPVPPLKASHASFSAADRKVPKRPSTAYDKALTPRNPISRRSIEEQPFPAQTADLERAMPGVESVGAPSAGRGISTFVHSWPEYGNHETRRAQYDR